MTGQRTLIKKRCLGSRCRRGVMLYAIITYKNKRSRRQHVAVRTSAWSWRSIKPMDQNDFIIIIFPWIFESSCWILTGWDAIFIILAVSDQRYLTFNAELFWLTFCFMNSTMSYWSVPAIVSSSQDPSQYSICRFPVHSLSIYISCARQEVHKVDAIRSTIPPEAITDDRWVRPQSTKRWSS